MDTFEDSKKEKLKNWLKKPENLALIGVLILVFAVRLYYFFITSNQPVWWDESEYMSAAKGYAGIIDVHLSGMRLPGFPLLMSSFFILGITSEPVIRFIALFIPSMIVIFLVYLCVKEMYPDRRIALLSMAIMAFLWEHLFYSNRFHTENFALIFQLFAIYILFRCHLKKQDLWIIKPKLSLLWITIFSTISVIFRPGNLPFVPAAFLFIVFINKKEIFQKKNIFFILAGIAGLILLFFIAVTQFPSMVSAYYQPYNPIAWYMVSAFYGFYQSLIPWLPSLLFYFFLFGVMVVIADFSINSGKIKRAENNAEDIGLKSDIFNAMVILSLLIIFIFFERSKTGYELRWFFPLITGMLAFTGKGIAVFSDYIGSFINSKKFSAILIIIIALLGIYTQFYHADMIIKMKVDSYSQVKEAALWIKDNSSPGDIVITSSYPQFAYYSERKIYDFYVNGSNQNETAFDDLVNSIKPKYFVISAFEPGFTPQWAYSWPERHNDILKPVKSYDMYDSSQQKSSPVLVVYEFINN